MEIGAFSKAFFDEYNARKVCSKPEDADTALKLAKATAPEWFKFEVGFTFMFGGDPAVVLGPGGYRVYGERKGELYTPKSMAGLLMAYMYKGEWHITDLGYERESGKWDWSDYRPIEDAMNDEG